MFFLPLVLLLIGEICHTLVTKYPKYHVKKITLPLKTFQWLSTTCQILLLLTESYTPPSLHVLVEQIESQGLDETQLDKGRWQTEFES